MPIPHINSYNASRWHSRQLPASRGKKPRRKKRWWRILPPLILIMALGTMAVLAWVSRDLPTPEGIAHRIVPLSTKIYDRTGKTVLYDIHGDQKRTAVELTDIPKNLKWATITAEDRTFYQHSGFKFTSMIRALLVNILRGDKSQGGSTITQQFIKNAILGPEKSYVRKIKELILAYQIERKFSKDEILKLYFNEIPYGSNTYGAEAAAQTFFGKSVKDLNLAESAILAALPKSTSYYSPWGSHREDLIARQHYILDGMAEGGYITKAEAETAKQAKLTFKPHRENIIAPHFVFYVKELMAAKYGEQAVEQGGLKIITSLDLTKQKIAEEAIAASAKKNLSLDAQNASLVALDVPTGQILSMVGSRDFFDEEHDGQVNVAVRPRQPGSSFKPIVYSTAFSIGFTPETKLFDVVTTFKTETKDYTPHNYDSKEHGIVSLRQALAGSLNIPAVKLLYLTGIDKVLEQAKKFGYTSLGDRSRFGLSLVLGGAEVSLLEHTNTYAAFAREGMVKPPIAILKVEDAQGNVLEQYQDSPGEKVMEAEPIRQLTSILTDNDARSFIFGVNNHLVLPDRPVAAKTGTTNDYHDAWSLGYTPQLAVGVWVGNNNNKEMKKGADGSVVAAPIWQDFFSRAVVGTQVQNFTPPQPTNANKPILNGELSNEPIEIDAASGKLTTDLTPSSYRITKYFKQYHTILRYVTPGDPLGPATQDPTRDPQYSSWEEPIRQWAEKNGLKDEQPPTETDPLHNDANRPQITIASPQTNQTITENPVVFKTEAQSKRGVRRVIFYLDGQEIGKVVSIPFELNFPITTEWPNGFHTIKAVAYDDIDNNQETSTTFNLLVTPLPTLYSMSFSDIEEGQKIPTNSFPLNIKVNISNPEQIKQLDLYITPQNQTSQWLGVATSLQNTAQFNWQKATPGQYSLSITITDKYGATKPGPQINVLVIQ